jgi:hypothetical protein
MAGKARRRESHSQLQNIRQRLKTSPLFRPVRLFLDGSALFGLNNHAGYSLFWWLR